MFIIAESELLAAALVPSGTLRERYRTPTPQKRFLGRASLSHSQHPKKRTACSSASLSHSQPHPKQRTACSSASLSHSPTSHNTPISQKRTACSSASLSHPTHPQKAIPSVRFGALRCASLTLSKYKIMI